MADTPERTHRRSEDDEDGDVRDQRSTYGVRRGGNGHTKWVISTISLIGLALLTFFATQYHERLTGDISTLQRSDASLRDTDLQMAMTIAQNHTEIEVLKANLVAMNEQLSRLEKNQELMLLKLDRRQ